MNVVHILCVVGFLNFLAMICDTDTSSENKEWTKNNFYPTMLGGGYCV